MEKLKPETVRKILGLYKSPGAYWWEEILPLLCKEKDETALDNLNSSTESREADKWIPARALILLESKEYPQEKIFQWLKLVLEKSRSHHGDNLYLSPKQLIGLLRGLTEGEVWRYRGGDQKITDIMTQIITRSVNFFGDDFTSGERENIAKPTKEEAKSISHELKRLFNDKHGERFIFDLVGQLKDVPSLSSRSSLACCLVEQLAYVAFGWLRTDDKLISCLLTRLRKRGSS